MPDTKLVVFPPKSVPSMTLNISISPLQLLTPTSSLFLAPTLNLPTKSYWIHLQLVSRWGLLLTVPLVALATHSTVLLCLEECLNNLRKSFKRQLGSNPLQKPSRGFPSHFQKGPQSPQWSLKALWNLGHVITFTLVVQPPFLSFLFTLSTPSHAPNRISVLHILLAISHWRALVTSIPSAWNSFHGIPSVFTASLPSSLCLNVTFSVSFLLAPYCCNLQYLCTPQSPSLGAYFFLA